MMGSWSSQVADEQHNTEQEQELDKSVKTDRDMRPRRRARGDYGDGIGDAATAAHLVKEARDLDSNAPSSMNEDDSDDEPVSSMRSSPPLSVPREDNGEDDELSSPCARDDGHSSSTTSSSEQSDHDTTPRPKKSKPKNVMAVVDTRMIHARPESLDSSDPNPHPSSSPTRKRKWPGLSRVTHGQKNTPPSSSRDDKKYGRDEQVHPGKSPTLPHSKRRRTVLATAGIRSGLSPDSAPREPTSSLSTASRKPPSSSVVPKRKSKPSPRTPGGSTGAAAAVVNGTLGSAQSHRSTGFYTPEEYSAVEKFKKEFCSSNSILPEQFNILIQHSSRNHDPFPFPGNAMSHARFWESVHAILTHRNKMSMARFMRRHFQVSQQKPHKWSTEQEKELANLVEKMGPKWTEIAKLLDRTNDDVTQRWKNRVEHRGIQREGPWSEEECEELEDALKQARARLVEDGVDVGKDLFELDEALIGWGSISNSMGHKRSRQQCADKWRRIRRRVVQARLRANVGSIPDNDTRSLPTTVRSRIVPGSLRSPKPLKNPEARGSSGKVTKFSSRKKGKSVIVKSSHRVGTSDDGDSDEAIGGATMQENDEGVDGHPEQVAGAGDVVDSNTYMSAGVPQPGADLRSPLLPSTKDNSPDKELDGGDDKYDDAHSEESGSLEGEETPEIAESLATEQEEGGGGEGAEQDEEEEDVEGDREQKWRGGYSENDIAESSVDGEADAQQDTDSTSITRQKENISLDESSGESERGRSSSKSEIESAESSNEGLPGYVTKSPGNVDQESPQGDEVLTTYEDENPRVTQEAPLNHVNGIGDVSMRGQQDHVYEYLHAGIAEEDREPVIKIEPGTEQYTPLPLFPLPHSGLSARGQTPSTQERKSLSSLRHSYRASSIAAQEEARKPKGNKTISNTTGFNLLRSSSESESESDSSSDSSSSNASIKETKPPAESSRNITASPGKGRNDLNSALAKQPQDDVKTMGFTPKSSNNSRNDNIFNPRSPPLKGILKRNIPTGIIQSTEGRLRCRLNPLQDNRNHRKVPKRATVGGVAMPRLKRITKRQFSSKASSDEYGDFSTDSDAEDIPFADYK